MRLYKFQYTIRNFKNKSVLKGRVKIEEIQQGARLGQRGTITRKWL